MIDLCVQDVVIPVSRCDTNGDSFVADTGRRGPLGDVGWIVGMPVPSALLHAEDRLRISTDLLDGEIFTPPDVKVIFRYIGCEV